MYSLNKTSSYGWMGIHIFLYSKLLGIFNSELYAKNHVAMNCHSKFLSVTYLSTNKSIRYPFTFAESKLVIQLPKVYYQVIQLFILSLFIVVLVTLRGSYPPAQCSSIGPGMWESKERSLPGYTGKPELRHVLRGRVGVERLNESP